MPFQAGGSSSRTRLQPARQQCADVGPQGRRNRGRRRDLPQRNPPHDDAAGGGDRSVAIGGGTILAVGSASGVSGLAGSSTKIVDLQGRTLLPGLIDPHHHTVLSAVFANLLTNFGYATYRTRADALAGLKEAAAKTPPGQWVRGGYFDNILQGGDLSMELLDAVSTEHPIFVIYVNGHTGAGNSLAFKLANIPQDVGTLPVAAALAAGPTAH